MLFPASACFFELPARLDHLVELWDKGLITAAENEKKPRQRRRGDDIEAASPPSLSDGKASLGVPTASDYSIRSSSEESKPIFQEQDELPTVRELLMNARAEGRNSEALTAYQKKVRSLKTLERKLQRQMDALEAAKERRTDCHTSDSVTGSQ